ncbi:MAG: homoserine dehydrogenase [Euryarchaeota archaeon]|nr:homoserine dehydrogenase [Euryarchaeota archaeon]MBV1728811.1 homoserine dehydrogenase [Methanobacterium sp.]MBU4548370.1 homoserine dehydrogenase [Euryarchaeota archaeon]MBU4608408.1 homoserine dehydrogenase [Euryarchaeota archaeon]MBV1755472.1 homoserine dehydrogenase [Methanobacterium sp.]
MKNDTVNIGLIGFGTIGTGVVTILNQNMDLIEKKSGKKINLKRIVDLDITTPRGVDVEPEKLSTNVDDILEDEEIDIVIELIGGYSPALNFILKALNKGKHVVTANKALLAKHWDEIISAAEENQVKISFEASVGGGIPLLQPLNESLAANHIQSIYGIINGTANYILTKMTQEGLNFHLVLNEAQKKGYAEQDPTFDVEGHDTAQKLILLTILGFGEYIPEEKFHVEGISKITPEDINFNLEEMGYVIKLLGISRKVDNQLEVRVHPTLIPQEHLLASVNGVYNGVYIEGDAVGPVMMYGQGAGSMPTASAVIGDCLDIINNPQKEIPFGPLKENPTSLKSMENVKSKYYIRLRALDHPGVLHSISGILSDFNISIESVSQKQVDDNPAVPIFIVTHKASENDLTGALKKIDELKDIKEKSMFIRILEE